MKYNISNYLDGIKKYGIPFLILSIIYYGMKRIYALVLLPILFFVLLKKIAIIFDLQWVHMVDVEFVILMWIFIFIVFRKMFNGMFEVNKD